MNMTFTHSANKKIYSVSELNRETKTLLHERFFNILVEGEISNLSRPASGHLYFTLKDKQAQIRCAMFRNAARHLNFNADNGQQIIAAGQVSLYEVRGDYQLIVNDIQETGDGALRRAFEALKIKLDKEGLFDPQNKQSLPKTIQQVAVITSPTGAAIKDILAVVKRRFPALNLVIYPVSVQGEAAKNEIAQAIEWANARQECQLILLSRGGGSLEDLWSFNEETVARAIHKSQLPVISAIGHEIDFTIADFVADIRCPTPSAAAELITPDSQEMLRILQQYEQRLTHRVENQLMLAKQALLHIDKRLQQLHPGRQLQSNFQRLDELDSRLQRNIQINIEKNHAALQQLSAGLQQHHPAAKIQTLKLQQSNLTQRLLSAQSHTFSNHQQQLANTARTLHAVSPMATLERGYAIVSSTEQQKLINDSSQLTTGQLVHTRLTKGNFTSRVEAIEEDN